jgi:hypothetical protein
MAESEPAEPQVALPEQEPPPVPRLAQSNRP